MAAPKLRPPPNIDNLDALSNRRELARWLFEFWRRITEAGVLDWSVIDPSASSLSDIADRRHELLQNIEELDPTSSDPDKTKHLSNAQAKVWQDHRSATTNIHGIVGALASAADVDVVEAAIVVINAAIVALQGDVNTAEADIDALQALVTTLQNSLSSHIAETSAHGAVGDVVGTENAQALVNKDIRHRFTTTAADLALDEFIEIVQVTDVCTITLPTAVGATGYSYIIDNAHSGATTITPDGSETIEGESSQTLTGVCCMGLYSDGANWRIK